MTSRTFHIIVYTKKTTFYDISFYGTVELEMDPADCSDCSRLKTKSQSPGYLRIHAPEHRRLGLGSSLDFDCLQDTVAHAKLYNPFTLWVARPEVFSLSVCLSLSARSLTARFAQFSSD